MFPFCQFVKPNLQLLTHHYLSSLIELQTSQRKTLGCDWPGWLAHWAKLVGSNEAVSVESNSSPTPTITFCNRSAMQKWNKVSCGKQSVKGLINIRSSVSRRANILTSSVPSVSDNNMSNHHSVRQINQPPRSVFIIGVRTDDVVCVQITVISTEETTPENTFFHLLPQQPSNRGFVSSKSGRFAYHYIT